MQADFLKTAKMNKRSSDWLAYCRTSQIVGGAVRCRGGQALLLPCKASLKYFTVTKRKAERDGGKETNESGPKAKRRKYDEAYRAPGFTVTTVGDERRPVCLLRLKMLAADSMKPNKLGRHLQTTHPQHAEKPLDFFLFSENVQSTANNHAALSTLHQ